METWKDIEGYSGFYQVSDCGRIRSRYLGMTYLKTHPDKDGYYKVNLMKDRKLKRFFVHRLVAMAFIKNDENKPCINHKDGNKQNNQVSNLEWVTVSENTKHAFKNGLATQRMGVNSVKAKLTHDDVLKIRELRLLGYGCRRLHRIFSHVSMATLNNIATGKTYKESV